MPCFNLPRSEIDHRQNGPQSVPMLSLIGQLILFHLTSVSKSITLWTILLDSSHLLASQMMACNSCIKLPLSLLGWRHWTQKHVSTNITNVWPLSLIHTFTISNYLKWMVVLRLACELQNMKVVGSCSFQQFSGPCINCLTNCFTDIPLFNPEKSLNGSLSFATVQPLWDFSPQGIYIGHLQFSTFSQFL
jgi:hypothetical protein